MDNNSVLNLLTWSSAVLVASLPGIIQLVASRLDERRKRIEHFDELKLAALTEYIDEVSTCRSEQNNKFYQVCGKIYLYVDRSQWDLITRINQLADAMKADEVHDLLLELIEQIDLPEQQRMTLKKKKYSSRGRK